MNTKWQEAHRTKAITETTARERGEVNKKLASWKWKEGRKERMIEGTKGGREGGREGRGNKGKVK